MKAYKSIITLSRNHSIKINSENFKPQKILHNSNKLSTISSKNFHTFYNTSETKYNKAKVY